MSKEDGVPPLRDSGEVHLSEPPEDEAEPAPEGRGAWSKLEDVEALLDDTLTYVDAEMAFQKTRVSLVVSAIKRVVGLVAAAAFIVVLALIGLTVGLIMALAPLVSAWGATAIVVGVYFVAAALLVRSAGKTWSRAMHAVRTEEEEPGEDA